LAAATPASSPPPRLLPPPDPRHRVRLGGGVLSQLPANDNIMALTVDDGVSSEVVRLYTRFARDTGVRLTFFLNGVNKSWTENRDELRPLVDSGQIQLGNHTWSHPDLTTVSTSRIRDELTRNDRFMKDAYGVDAAPYFRPPYGKRNSVVDTVAADLGYTVPTLWSGSLADSTVITEDYIVKMANQYFTPRTIVLGHLNHLPVTHVYGQLVDIIRARNIRTVTLNDVFLKG
jgi:peptidoglycan/xylan/chitin deacetylase (PgdA/CDA1 family)